MFRGIMTNYNGKIFMRRKSIVVWMYNLKIFLHGTGALKHCLKCKSIRLWKVPDLNSLIFGTGTVNN